jgi:hypothetical protein
MRGREVEGEGGGGRESEREKENSGRMRERERERESEREKERAIPSTSSDMLAYVRGYIECVLSLQCVPLVACSRTRLFTWNVFWH